MKALNSDELVSLLRAQPTTAPPNIQTGPLRWYDREMRCANRGCTSPTYIKVEGVPKCHMHALLQLNEMLS